VYVRLFKKTFPMHCNLQMCLLYVLFVVIFIQFILLLEIRFWDPELCLMFRMVYLQCVVTEQCVTMCAGPLCIRVGSTCRFFERIDFRFRQKQRISWSSVCLSHFKRDWASCSELFWQPVD